MDLLEQLDDQIGPGPRLPDPEQRLVAGRRALRRRRTRLGAVVLAAAAVVAAVPVALTATGPGSASDDPAAAASSAPPASATPTPVEPPGTDGLEDSPVDSPVEVLRDGRLRFDPAAEVADRRVGRLEDGSVWEAYAVRFEGEDLYVGWRRDMGKVQVLTVIRRGDVAFEEFARMESRKEAGAAVTPAPPGERDDEGAS